MQSGNKTLGPATDRGNAREFRDTSGVAGLLRPISAVAWNYCYARTRAMPSVSELQRQFAAHRCAHDSL